MLGAEGKQHVSEAARRTADIHGRHACWIEPEMRDCVRQLDPPARNPRMITPAHLELRIGGQGLPGLGQLGLERIDMARKDQRLRAGAALREPALDQQLIKAHFRFCSGFARSWGRWRHGTG